jgi:hypothetical protein
MDPVPTLPGLTTVTMAEMAMPQDIYVLDGVVTARPAFVLSYPVGLAVAVDAEWSATGIPAGTTVTYPGGAEVVNDGAIEWASDAPGSFDFRFELFPYLPEVVRVEVA